MVTVAAAAARHGNNHTVSHNDHWVECSQLGDTTLDGDAADHQHWMEVEDEQQSFEEGSFRHGSRH